MRQKRESKPESAEQTVRDIRRATRRQYSAEEKIRIVLEGLGGEESIAELCRRKASIQPQAGGKARGAAAGAMAGAAMGHAKTNDYDNISDEAAEGSSSGP